MSFYAILKKIALFNPLNTGYTFALLLPIK